MTDQLGELNRQYVKDRKVCVTGRLVSLTHAQLGEIVDACGGIFVRYPTRSSMILVIGDGGWPTQQDGTPSRVLYRARQLKAYGYEIDFVSEDEFLERIGLTDSAVAIRGLYTIVDVAAIMEIPVARLRRWVRCGLIEPVESHFHLDYFDMRQVSFARRVGELIEQGTSIQSIRHGIEQLEASFPQEAGPIKRLARLESDGRMLVRVEGSLLDTDGQRYFDFGDASEATVSGYAYWAEQEVAGLFDTALAREDEGDLAGALAAYQHALELAPRDAVVFFNLGNVQFGLGRVDESIVSYSRALEINPDYVEAWNNLGNAFADQRRWEEAAKALRNALVLLPAYADAHFNLAHVCRHLGDLKEAAAHQMAYEQNASAARALTECRKRLNVFRAED